MKTADYLISNKNEWFNRPVSADRLNYLFHDYQRQGGTGNIEQFRKAMKDRKLTKYLEAVK